MKNKVQPLISIIILNYNTPQITLNAISSIEESYSQEVTLGLYEVIIVDNNSTDNSQDALKEFSQITKIKLFKTIYNKSNVGFSAGNNIGVKHATSDLLLFLNSDTIVNKKVIPYMITFLQNHKLTGAATCKVLLRTGKIDDASHRGFPTPWNAFCHFSGLENLFPKSKLFAKYSMTFIKNIEKTHEIDALAGAFMMISRQAGDKVGWWDEDYFLYGEDIDFCYRLKNAGLKIYYVPAVSILHLKGTSLGIRDESKDITNVQKDGKIASQNARFDAMKIFYKKHYMDKYPKLLTKLIFWQLETMRKNNIKKYR